MQCSACDGEHDTRACEHMRRVRTAKRCTRCMRWLRGAAHAVYHRTQGLCVLCLDASAYVRRTKQYASALPSQTASVRPQDAQQPEAKKESLHINLREEQRAVLARIAAANGLSLSGALGRMLENPRIVSIALDAAKERR